MTKFSKFLDEKNKEQSSINKFYNNQKTKDFTSLKIKMDTLDTLRILKTVTKEESYSVLIKKMIDVYTKQLPEEEQDKLKKLL